MDRLSRVISIMTDLMHYRKVDTSFLARKYEVSTRTIYRDIEMLSLSGIPILSERGKNGGFSIIEGFKLDKSIVTETEFGILLRGLQTLINNNDKDAEHVYDKLISILENSKKEKVVQHSNKIMIDVSPFTWQEKFSQYYQLFSTAIENKYLVEITYYSVEKGLSNRVIEPVMLLFKSKNWYLYAYCHERKEFRYFKLSRIKSVTILEEHFVEREIHVEKLSNSFHTVEEIEVVLQTDKTFALRLQDTCRVVHVEEKNDFVYVTIKYPINDWLYAMILSFADKAIVVSPKEIREGVAQMFQKMSSLYEKQNIFDKNKKIQ